MDNAREKDAVIKVTESIRDAVNAIGAELGGKTQKEVAELFLALYQKDRAERTGESIPHLDVLREFFLRVEGIYTEAVLIGRDRDRFNQERIMALEGELQKTKAELLDKQRELDAAAAAQKEQDRQTAEKIEATRAEAALAREEASREMAAMRELLDEARKSEEKSHRLASLMQEAADQANQRAAQFEERAKLADQALRERDEALKSLEALRGEFDRFKQQAAFDRDRAVLDAEKAAMRELREANDEINRLRIQLSSVSSTISEPTDNE